MKILLVHNFYRFRGGEETYLDDLTRLLKEKGHTLVFYTKNNKNLDLSAKGLLTLFLGFFRNQRMEKEFGNLIKKSKPDIVHFNNVYPLITPLAYRVAKKHGLPVVQTIHSLRFLFPWMFPQTFGRTLVYSLVVLFHRLWGTFRNVDAFLFPNPVLKNFYIKNAGIHHQKAFFIPHFVEALQRSTVKKDYFLYVGRLAKDKGIYFLLKVFAKLKNLRLVVIGTGPLEKRLRRKYDLAHIKFTGQLTRKRTLGYLAQAAGLIIPSQVEEGGPLVLIEAFAYATPVIAPNLASFKYAIAPGKTGLLYRQNDPADLKEKILALAKNSRLRRRMGLLARKKYFSDHTPNIYYRKLMTVYSRIL